MKEGKERQKPLPVNQTANGESTAVKKPLERQTKIYKQRSSLARRDKAICEMIFKDGATATAVSKAYGVCRERVRQVYAKYRPTSYPSYTAILKERARKKKEARDSEVAFICKTCGKIVTEGERSAEGRWAYCSDRCYKKLSSSRRDKTKTFACDYCGKRFHPYSHWDCPSSYKGTPHKSKRRFCSMECYKRGGAGSKERFLREDLLFLVFFGIILTLC